MLFKHNGLCTVECTERPVQNKRDRRLRQLHPLLLCSKEKEIRADGVIVFALLRSLSLLIPLSIIPSG